MNYLDSDRALALAECYSKETSIRSAAVIAGCAKRTVERYYKAFRNRQVGTPYATEAPASEAANPLQECRTITPQSPWQPIETAPKGSEHTVLVWDEVCFSYPTLAYWDDGYRIVKKKRVLADKPRWRCVEDELQQYAECEGGLVPDWWLPWSPPPKAQSYPSP